MAGPTPLRLSFTVGDVRFWRPGAEEWVPAQINTPLAPGDQLVTDHLGNVEIQTAPSSFLRVWGDSRFGLTSHDENALRIGITNGYLGLDLRSVAPGERLYVDTPHAALTIGEAGYYRVDVSTDRTAVITRRGGRATVTAHGHTVSLAADHQVLAGSAPAPALAPSTAPEADAWDRWSIGRTDTLLAAESARYVAPQMYGARDLDLYGTWREEPTYGPVWQPRGVPAGWVPYSTGTWISDPGYGWTWIDTAPWGWAPYHHGRWIFVNGAWAWAPGPRVVRAVYAPALVAFFGAPQPVGRPFVSWVALGWGEPLVPWWGRAGFVGRPWYAGWGGPRHWHRDRFHGRPFDYRNVAVRNAVVGVHRERFGRERVERARLAAIDVNRLQPVREPRPIVRDGDAGRGTRRQGGEAPSERQRESAITLPRPTAGAPGRQAPSLRPAPPRERPTPAARSAEPDAGEEPKTRIAPRRRDPEPPAAPERARDRTVAPPRAAENPTREAPSLRPETPRERPSAAPRSSDPGTREEPKARTGPPRTDLHPRTVPDRARDRAVTPPRAADFPTREAPSVRPDAPRERQSPAVRSFEPDTREEPRGRAVAPQVDRDPPGGPRSGSPARGAAPPQQWRRTGDVGGPRPSAPASPDRTGGIRRERDVPASARGGSEPRGRR